MEVSKKELLHIADLAKIKISDEEVDSYLSNLQDILNFANIINKVDTSSLNETMGISENVNVFRKDEVKNFDNKENMLKQNPEELEENMIKIPKVLN